MQSQGFPTTKLSLDDIYHMLAHIYSDKNVERPVTVTLAHFIEVCGMLTTHAKEKNREEFSIEDALCKTLGWYFPLLAKFKVRSVQELIYRKYPNVCPYCRLEIHEEKKCKQIRGTHATVDHGALRGAYNRNKNIMPVSLNEWQEMFARIYPRSLKGRDWSVNSLFEELGELAEAIRVFETHPKYFAGEAADVFSYIMGIATEHSLVLQSQNKPEFNFEGEFLKRYPGLCPQCGYQICICPVIPDATIGRMAKELPLAPDDDLFSLNVEESETRAASVCTNVLQTSGGFVEVAKHFPYDRGDTNRAMVFLCLKLAEAITTTKPPAAKALQDAAIAIGASPKRPGEKAKGKAIEEVIHLLRKLWPEISLSIFAGDNTITGVVARKLQMQACKIGIVTALPKEFAAMRTMFEDSSENPVVGDPNDYVLGTIPARDGSGMHLVALTLLKEMGNNSAACAAAHLFRSFGNIEDVLMVGIAGGIPSLNNPDKHVRLGDIVVSNHEGVIQYDNLQRGGGTIKLRGVPSKPSARMTGRVGVLEAGRLRGHFPWEEYLSRGEQLENGKRPSEETDQIYIWSNGNAQLTVHPPDPSRRKNRPKVHYGRIGAANTLLKDPDLRDQLCRDLNVIAVEMEGSGIADGTWTAGQQYILIRGICDYCDPKKNDDWQGYAAVAASSYARALIESMSIEP
jgi:nucleoside phosphorylase/NTP pyrophosphatase (non-canonical NTP hydrolase)